MVKYERCNTPCHKEMPCTHDACPNYRVKAYYCDCCREPAAYERDGKHYCSDCLEEELEAEFGKRSVREKIEALGYKDEITEV